MTKIKFCGLSRVEDLAFAEELKIDYAGFVAVKSSKRHVSLEQIVAFQDWRKAHAASIQPILVTMDLALEAIVEITDATGVRHVQLAGDETPELCRELRSRHALTVWKSWHVPAIADADRPALEGSPLVAYADAVDGVLLDTTLRGQKGGTGSVFDWDRIAAFKQWLAGLPLIVAGGLTVDNVAGLIEQHRPFAVDVSSGIEAAGEKDFNKMREFATQARGARHESRPVRTVR